jgi:hypothetical protein
VLAAELSDEIGFRGNDNAFVPCAKSRLKKIEDLVAVRPNGDVKNKH